MTNKTLQYLIDTDDFKDFKITDYSHNTQGQIGVVLFFTCKITHSTFAVPCEWSLDNIKESINNHYKNYKLEKCL